MRALYAPRSHKPLASAPTSMLVLALVSVPQASRLEQLMEEADDGQLTRVAKFTKLRVGSHSVSIPQSRLHGPHSHNLLTTLLRPLDTWWRKLTHILERETEPLHIRAPVLVLTRFNLGLKDLISHNVLSAGAARVEPWTVVGELSGSLSLSTRDGHNETTDRILGRRDNKARDKRATDKWLQRVRSRGCWLSSRSWSQDKSDCKMDRDRAIRSWAMNVDSSLRILEESLAAAALCAYDKCSENIPAKGRRTQKAT